jgi:hypothetical protein
MKNWNQFYDLLLPWVPGCPLPMADLQLRTAARRFCDKTMVWREWLGDITTDGAAVVFDVSKSGQQEVVQLLRATLAGETLNVIRQEDVPGDWRTNYWPCPSIFGVNAGSQLALVPLQATGLTLKTEATLRPSLVATGIPDAIFAKYAEAIAWGAAAILAAMKNKPYSDANSPTGDMFAAAINDAATDIAHSFSAAPMRTRASFL